MSDSWSDVDLVMTTIIDTCLTNEKYFGDLDSVVGDGDFGYSLARGFEKLQAQYGELDRTDIGTFFKKVGMLVTSRIGGTSGPIWGTGFLRAGMTAGATTVLDGATVVAMLRSAIAGIMARGGASLGEKTLLDALVPMTDVIEAALADGVSSDEVVDRAAVAARSAADATIDLVAKRGRAAYTGERSRGSVDAGATAVAVLMEQIAEKWKGRNSG
ncbi:dihydroxyacetone kinase/dihydroxyacetone kinase-like protein [Kribbella rubisoli]|uniref:Dihydroxyacetone kinase/dihydroxyacetone kinase-like protein n=1 Tax=Kribbella rubisoli TaxID=3075929 RepID=A0A4Q7WL13_9ACTN|nr:dihydroxyacetone kinase subunit DhaL [Kribbella rubisoli]RZU10225.1 dihydroxyacetone kinase/dihydroxyacetone kinase-like protein [Kribbella rubisoli]